MKIAKLKFALQTNEAIKYDKQDKKERWKDCQF